MAERAGEDAVLQVLASDHEIDADERYFDAIRIARDTALSGKLVTFGISPSEPATGYGYIERTDDVRMTTPTGTAFRASRFVEKPQSTAPLPDDPNAFFASMGNYVFDTDVLIDAVTRDHDLEDSKHDMGGDIVPAFVAEGVLIRR